MLSIGTTFNYDIPLKTQLPMIKAAGFTHISLGGGNLEHSGYLNITGQRNLKEMIQDSGLKICSIHAPFKDVDVSSPEKSISLNAMDLLKRCIDSALFLGAKTIIFHPVSISRVDSIEDRKEILLKQVYSLLEYIGKKDIQLAIENLPSGLINDLVYFSLDRIDNSKYGLCYDSSHDNLLSEPLTILGKYGNRLFTTHISDNRGEKDDHILPFEGTFKWDEFTKVFHKIGFEGIFLLEVEMRRSAFQKPQEFLNEAFKRAQILLK
ncbi:MAG: sugar phosphate isomerase/epimerase family protein [bacterium]